VAAVAFSGFIFLYAGTNYFIKINSVERTPTKTAIFVLFDSTKLGVIRPTDLDAIATWPEVNAVLTDCRLVTSLTCKVFFFFYKDDTWFNDTFQKTILLHFKNASSSNKQAARSRENNIEFNLRTVPRREESARHLGDIIKEVYIKSVEYFYLILSRQSDGAAKTGAGRKSVFDLTELLAQTKPFTDVGIAVQTSVGGSEIIGIMLSHIHLEIFGELFPYEITTLGPASEYLLNVYPKILVHRIVDGILIRSTDGLDIVFDTPDELNSSDVLKKQSTRTLKRFVEHSVFLTRSHLRLLQLFSKTSPQNRFILTKPDWFS